MNRDLTRPLVGAIIVGAVVGGCSSTETLVNTRRSSVTGFQIAEKALGKANLDPPIRAEGPGGDGDYLGYPYAIVDERRVAVPNIPMGDPATIARILDEGRNRNQTLVHLKHLSENIGARLTGSSAVEEANNWSRDQFDTWGLTNAELFEWGTIAVRFDRGPSTGKAFSSVQTTDDDGAIKTEDRELRDVNFSTLAWTAGTDGPRRGRAVIMPRTIAEYEAIKSDLSGAWVLVPPDDSGRRGLRGASGLMRTRHTLRAEARERMASGDAPVMGEAPEPIGPRWEGTVRGPNLPESGMPTILMYDVAEDGSVTGTFEIPDLFKSDILDGRFDGDTGALTFDYNAMGARSSASLNRSGEALSGAVQAAGAQYDLQFAWKDAEVPAEQPEGVPLEWILGGNVSGFVSSSQDERVWTTSVSGWRELDPDNIAQDVEVQVTGPDFDFLMNKLNNKKNIALEFDLQHTLTPGPIPVYNTVAEIRGTTYPDEVVIVSAHLDSWNGPGSQGTVDNGTGSSVTMEAARILATVGARPKRTIRFILWTGEEQGLLGSRVYVEHLEATGEIDKISAVLVDDGGTNSEGGLQAVGPMVPMLAAATAPVNGQFFDHVQQRWLNVNVRTLDRMPRGGGSDHASFNRVGVPGFFWDEIGRANYRYAWHTQRDRIDQAIPEYLVQSSTCAAITAYNLACAPTMLPREIKMEEPAQASTR